ncbi:MAG: hypothetical protein IEMM0002_1390 [bacterium]|nr:MAG: hypothetical protein IEMM0002_1390 [bacterium]
MFKEVKEVKKLLLAAAVLSVLAQGCGNLVNQTSAGNQYTNPGSENDTAVLIDAVYGGNAYSPKIAMDESGNGLAVWRQDDGSSDGIYSSSYDKLTGSWKTANLLESTAGNVFLPEIAVNGSGDAVAVWRQDTKDVYASRYLAAAGRWEAPKKIENNAEGYIFYLKTAIDDNGDSVIVWQQLTEAGYNIYFSRSDAATGSWSDSSPIGTYAGYAYFPELTVDGSGNVIAAWRQWDGNHYSVYANRYDAAGSAWGETKSMENISGNSGDPRAAADAHGNTVIVWQHDAGSIYANRYNASTKTWGGVEHVWSVADSNSGLHVSVDRAGNTAVVWRSRNETKYYVYACRYDVKTSSWDSARYVGTVPDTANDITIALNDGKDVMAVWYQNNDGYQGIWYEQYMAATL